MPHSKKNPAFTLVEILIAVMILSLLSISAYSMFVQSTGTIKFLKEFRNAKSAISTARSFALTSKDVKGKVPDRYGVRIESGCIATFADTGATAYSFDGTCATNATAAGEDQKIKNFKLDDFQMEVQHGATSHDPIPMPVEIYYEKHSGDVTVIDNNNITISKTIDRYVDILFWETDDDTNRKYIVIFQVSGLPEEFDQEKFDALSP